MSFDQDPNEQANISGADLAIMIDEIKSLQKQLADLRNATLEEAAKVCEVVWPETRGQFIGDVIRALKTSGEESA